MLERIKRLCLARNINFSRLEKELGFANGSIAKSKEDKISAARVKAIADYFGVSMEYILCGIENTNDESVFLYQGYELADSATQAAVNALLRVHKSDS